MADKYLSAAGKRRKVYINTFEAFDELMADICRQKTSSYYSCHSMYGIFKLKKLCSHLQCRGEGGAAPFKKNDVILRVRPQTAWHPKDLVLTELFLGQRGAGEVVCNAPKNKIYMKMKNHCVLSKLHSDFVYVDFKMCEQNCLTLVLRLFTSNFNVQAPRRPRNNSVVTISFGRKRSADAPSG